MSFSNIRIYLSRHKAIRSAATLTVLAAAVGGGTAIAEGTSADSSAPLGVGLAASPSALAAMQQAYPVLKSAQAPSDIPDGPVDPFLVQQGVKSATIRRATVTPDGVSVYLAPGNGDLCIATSDGAINQCGQFPQATSTEAVADESAVCAQGLGADYEVAWILPSGVRTAQISLSNGSSSTVSVTNGVVDLKGPRSGPLPKTISWSGPSGAGSSWSGLPSDTATTQCAS